MKNDKEMSEEDNKVTQEVENVTEPAKVEGENQADEENSEEDHEDEEIDYSGYSKPKLLHVLKDILKSETYIKSDAVVNNIKAHYDEIYLKEKDAAKEQFVADGGSLDDFDYRDADIDREFFAVYHDFKDRRSRQIKENEKAKERNAYAKNAILDRLRELVDSEETTSSIDAVKQIQQEWKSIGAVPTAQNRNLWASYNALMDRYYDNRSIYFELKELDRKKNLEAKLEICAKAEALSQVDDLKEAIKTLNDLHEEFKHIGPVPREDQEQVWQRFKAASDAVYARRKEHYEQQKSVYKENLTLKQKLIGRLESFKDFKADRIKDWNTKTKEMLAIQKEWEAIGPVPKEFGRDINKSFWGSFKQFFNHKNLFFKELDEIRKSNKEKAEQLISQAEAHQDSMDWKSSADELIKLQKEWKELGPMPERSRDDLYARFKSACDTFFQNRRNSNKEANKEFSDNLEKKQALCAQMKKDVASGDALSERQLEEYIREFNAIGFVPRKNIKEVAAAFAEAVDSYIARLGVDGSDREEFLFRLNLNKIQSDPNSTRVLNKKEHGIRKQIADLENNITLWKNNLEFFASSKTADKLKDQFEEKIEKAEEEVERLKKKLSIIREF